MLASDRGALPETSGDAGFVLQSPSGPHHRAAWCRRPKKRKPPWPMIDVGVDLKRVTSYGTHLSDGARARNAAGDRVSSFYDLSSCRMHGLA